MSKQTSRSKYYVQRLPKATYKTLQAFCLSARGDDLELVKRIADEVTGDMLGWWIVRAVTSKNWPWARLEAHHVPASHSTFYIYRQKFFIRLAEERGLEKYPPPSEDSAGGGE